MHQRIMALRTYFLLLIISGLLNSCLTFDARSMVRKRYRLDQMKRDPSGAMVWKESGQKVRKITPTY